MNRQWTMDRRVQDALTGTASEAVEGAGRTLRRIPLKEEYVELTGEHTRALILAQFEHRYKSSRYVDDYIAEEAARARAAGESVNVEPTHGWIRMDAQKLAKEVMLRLDSTTMRRRLKPLVSAGWIMERDDPRHSWDRTKQYRFDPIQVARDLWTLGYVLAGWHFPREVHQLIYGDDGNSEGKQPAKAQDAFGKTQDRSGDLQARDSKTQDREGQNAGSYKDNQIPSSDFYSQNNQTRGRRRPEKLPGQETGEERGDRPGLAPGDQERRKNLERHLNQLVRGAR